MNANEIVRALRTPPVWGSGTWIGNTEKAAADLIESLTAQLVAMRNELCLMCGKYKQAHLGACEGCRWRADEKGEKG